MADVTVGIGIGVDVSGGVLTITYMWPDPAALFGLSYFQCVIQQWRVDN